METRIALIGIIIENQPENIDEVNKMNSILSDFSKFIIGRMGVPYKEKDINVISIVIDAPQNIISSLSGKLGMLKNISTKTVYSKR